jgi:hypothetical protein
MISEDTNTAFVVGHGPPVGSTNDETETPGGAPIVQCNECGDAFTPQQGFD